MAWKHFVRKITAGYNYNRPNYAVYCTEEERDYGNLHWMDIPNKDWIFYRVAHTQSDLMTDIDVLKSLGLRYKVLRLSDGHWIKHLP